MAGEGTLQRHGDELAFTSRLEDPAPAQWSPTLCDSAAGFHSAGLFQTSSDAKIGLVWGDLHGYLIRADV